MKMGLSESLNPFLFGADVGLEPPTFALQVAVTTYLLALISIPKISNNSLNTIGNAFLCHFLR